MAIKFYSTQSRLGKIDAINSWAERRFWRIFSKLFTIRHQSGAMSVANEEKSATKELKRQRDERMKSPRAMGARIGKIAETQSRFRMFRVFRTYSRKGRGWRSWGWKDLYNRNWCWWMCICVFFIGTYTRFGTENTMKRETNRKSEDIEEQIERKRKGKEEEEGCSSGGGGGKERE